MPHAKIRKNRIGKRLKEARNKQNMTQSDLSAALSVDFDIEMQTRVIRRIENGERPVRDEELHALAKILGVTPDWLMGWK